MGLSISFIKQVCKRAGADSNPNDGISNFDHIGSAALLVFQVRLSGGDMT
jgi:hypothetical protein